MTAGVSPRGVRRALIALLLLLAFASPALGCGSGQGSSATQSHAAKAAVLKNVEWGFSLRYPASFVKVEPALDARHRGLLYQAYLADPAGAKSGGTALDVLGIAIHRLSKSARPGDVRTHASEFEAIAAQLAGKPEGLRVVQSFRPATLGGRPAIKGEYVYRLKDVDVAAVAYLVPINKRAYWVTGQASRETWRTSGRNVGAALSTMAFE